MLSAEQHAEFNVLGVVKLRVFSPAEAGRMRDAVWGELACVHGIRRDEPASWRAGNVHGLERIRELPTFVPIMGCRAAIDDLLGPESWDVPSAVWHVDFSYALPPEPLSGIKVFTFLSDVPARGGRTLVVTGSHRVIQRFIKGRSLEKLRNTRRTRFELCGSHQWLRDLTSWSSARDRVRRFIDHGSTIEGIAVRAVELTGEAGEVVLTHPWVMHCRAPNYGQTPRFMRTVDIYRREGHPTVFPLRRATP